MQNGMIRIPFDWFDQEDINVLKDDFPVMTVLRKERSLTQDQWDRLKLDLEASKIELGGGSQKLYDKRLDTLQESTDQQLSERKYKTPRIGVEGCCGRGCNGCLIFWNEPAYEKARQLMEDKKQGEMLAKGVRIKNDEAAQVAKQAAEEIKATQTKIA